MIVDSLGEGVLLVVVQKEKNLCFQRGTRCVPGHDLFLALFGTVNNRSFCNLEWRLLSMFSCSRTLRQSYEMQNEDQKFFLTLTRIEAVGRK